MFAFASLKHGTQPRVEMISGDDYWRFFIKDMNNLVGNQYLNNAIEA